VFADVDPHSFSITKETVKRVVTRRTKAILPVNLFGFLPPLADLCGLGLPVVEDACQSVGAHRTGRFSGSLGIAGAYSFNGAKNVPAGECGALVTNNAKVAAQARLWMNHAENFGKDFVSYNFRPNELTCCVAYHGLLELGDNNRQRIALAQILTEYIRAEKKLRRYIEIPESVQFDGSHVFYCYPFKIRGMSRSHFAKRMKGRFNQLVGEGYIRPALHEYKAFKPYAKGHLPVVEHLSSESLCLFYDVVPGATAKDMQNKVEAIMMCVGAG
jgi:perosamine synthetase